MGEQGEIMVSSPGKFEVVKGDDLGHGNQSNRWDGDPSEDISFYGIADSISQTEDLKTWCLV